jgi:hypothetical protein
VGVGSPVAASQRRWHDGFSKDLGHEEESNVGWRARWSLSSGASIWIAPSRPKGQEMGKVIVMNWVTLDGVMQGPGRTDEDTRDGFAHGGWGSAYSDEATVAKVGERMGGDRAFLFGRRTYEELLASWNAQGGPFKDALSTTLASSSPRTTQRRGSTGRTRHPAARRRSGRRGGPQAKLRGEPRDHG